jgi:3-hydroxyacyl-[acyl-carrier-protein] dehydratase
MGYEALLKKHRKTLLFDPAAVPVKLECGKDQIKRIIPQREPLLFIDGLTGVNLDEGLISGFRTIDPKDPVFEGHFPGYPVYPGSFTLEMIGQLSLCMYYFLENRRDNIAHDAVPVSARATRVIGAHFLEPILPGSTITLLAKKLEYAGFLAIGIGQALVDDTICCVSVGEVAIL